MSGHFEYICRRCDVRVRGAFTRNALLALRAIAKYGVYVSDVGEESHDESCHYCADGGMGLLYCIGVRQIEQGAADERPTQKPD